MRFVRLLAATAALACSTLAGQAQAAQIYKLSFVMTPELAAQSITLPGFPVSRHKVAVLTSAPVTGLIRIEADVNIQKYRNFALWDWNNERLNWGVDLYSARAGSFVAGCGLYAPGYYDVCSLWKDPTVLLDFSGSNITGPTTITLSGFSFVPEPSTWSLMILGMAAIGAACRSGVRSRGRANDVLGRGRAGVLRTAA